MNKLIYIMIVFGLIACGHSNQKQNFVSNDSLAIALGVRDLNAKILAEPEKAELYFERANIFFSQKYYDKAEEDLQTALQIDSLKAEYYLLLGRVLYASNRTIKAAEDLEKAIKLKPDFTEAKLKLAELYLVVVEHQKSLSLLNSVLTSDKTNAFAHYLKGMNYKDMGDTAKAISELQTAFEYDDRDFNSCIILANLLSAQNNKLAIEYYTAALRLRPTDADAFFGRAVLYQKFRLYKAALKDYEKVVHYEPKNSLCYYNVGYINFETKNFDRAISNFNTCIKMNTEYLPAYYMRGLCYEILKNNVEAKSNYDYVLSVDAGFALAKEGLSRLKN